jgi:hypothetical protein
MEIGYYSGNLAEMILTSLMKAQDLGTEQIDPNLVRLAKYVGFHGFTFYGESTRSRREQLVIPYYWQGLGGEHVLQIKVDDVSVPCSDDAGWEEPSLAKFRCTRMEIQFQPSMLDYFFPYADEQSLLTSKETDYLRSHNKVALNDTELLPAIRGQIREGSPSSIVVEGTAAQVECYLSDQRTQSLTIYGDEDVESCLTGGRFRCYGGIPSLRTAVPLISRLDVRRDCATNLTNLWYRFRLYERIRNPSVADPAGRKPAYPTPATWCDDIMSAYRSAIDPHVKEGECGYAMNPGCASGSPPDTVLLFEAKADWNQHGGPELFTFDNHDPKGGLVLLNDGTVRFIRTKKQLKQLRWK